MTSANASGSVVAVTVTVGMSNGAAFRVDVLWLVTQGQSAQDPAPTASCLIPSMRQSDGRSLVLLSYFRSSISFSFSLPLK